MFWLPVKRAWGAFAAYLAIMFVIALLQAMAQDIKSDALAHAEELSQAIDNQDQKERYAKGDYYTSLNFFRIRFAMPTGSLPKTSRI